MIRRFKQRLAVACASAVVLAGVFAGAASAQTEAYDRSVDYGYVNSTWGTWTIQNGFSYASCGYAWNGADGFYTSGFDGAGNRYMFYACHVNSPSGAYTQTCYGYATNNPHGDLIGLVIPNTCSGWVHR